MSSSGPNASKTSWRSLFESLSSVSSSWLRTKFAYWHSSETAIVSRSASASGSASWRASASQSRLHHREVEEQVDLVGVFPAEEVDQLLRRHVDLAEQQAVALSAGDERPEVPKDLVRVEVDVGDLARVDQERHGVHAEAVDAELEPEPGDLAISSRTRSLPMFRSGWCE